MNLQEAQMRRVRPSFVGPRLLAVTAMAVCLTLLLGLENVRAESPIEIKIGWQPAEELNFFIAKDAKLFEKAGLKPTYIRFNAGPPMLAALRTGDVDVGYMGSPPALSAFAQGLPVSVFFIESDAGASESMVVQPDSGIDGPEDLAGKTIGVWRGTSAEFALGHALAKAGVDRKEVKILDLDVTALIASFRTKEVDGIHVWDPWALRAIEMGGKTAFRDWDVGVRLPIVWLGRHNWLENPEGGKRFIQALMEADAIRRADPERAAAVASKTLGMELSTAKKFAARNHFLTAKELMDTSHPLSINPDSVKSGKGAVKIISDIAAFLVEVGRIKQMPDVANRIDSRPLVLAVDN